MRVKIGKFVGKHNLSFGRPTARKTFKILLYLIFAVALLAGSTQPKPVKPETEGAQPPMGEMNVDPGTPDERLDGPSSRTSSGTASLSGDSVNKTRTTKTPRAGISSHPPASRAFR